MVIGQSHFSLVSDKGVSIISAYSIPPNWDINIDGNITVLDFILISNHFNETGINGWIREDIDNIADTIMEFTNGKETYVSIDIDIIDPAYAPGTGYPEPGGLSSGDMLYILQRIKHLKNIRIVDLVEINPTKVERENKRTLAIGTLDS